jgi:hypothetical protein
MKTKIGVLNPKFCCCICLEPYIVNQIYNEILINRRIGFENTTLHFKCYQQAMSKTKIVTTIENGFPKFELVYHHELPKGFGLMMYAKQPTFTKKMFLGDISTAWRCGKKEDFEELMQIYEKDAILNSSAFFEYFMKYEGGFDVVDNSDAHIYINFAWINPDKETQIPSLFAMGLLLMGGDFLDFFKKLESNFHQVSGLPKTDSKEPEKSFEDFSPAKTNVLSIFIHSVLLVKKQLSIFSEKFTEEMMLDNFKSLVKTFIQMRGTVDLRDMDGDNHQNTPLIWSACNGLIEYSRILIQNGADVYAQDEKGFTSFAWLFYGIDEKLTPDLLNSYIDLFESAAGKTFLIEEEKKDSLKHIQAALDRIIYKALSDVIARRIKEAKEAIKKSETEKVDKQQAEIERLSNELEKLKTQERAIEATDSKTVQILLNINGQEKYYLLNSDKKTLVVNVFVENKTESS